MEDKENEEMRGKHHKSVYSVYYFINQLSIIISVLHRIIIIYYMKHIKHIFLFKDTGFLC